MVKSMFSTSRNDQPNRKDLGQKHKHEHFSTSKGTILILRLTVGVYNKIKVTKHLKAEAPLDASSEVENFAASGGENSEGLNDVPAKCFAPQKMSQKFKTTGGPASNSGNC